MKLRAVIGEWIFWLARLAVVGFALRWTVKHMPFLIPAHTLHETATLVAFEHPRPSYRVHVVLLPRAAYRNLLEVPEDADDFRRDLFTTTQYLVGVFHLEETGYRLIVNGGAYQDVPVLHFHFIAE